MSWLDRLAHGWRLEDEPRRGPEGDPTQLAEVRAVLDELRPLLRADGGDVELAAIRDGWIELRMLGACTRCPSISSTVAGALEPSLRARLDWMRGLRML